MNFLRLIRLPNLLLLGIMMLSFRYGFLKQHDIYLALADWQYILLIFATIFIAAAGYIINDVFDRDTDMINKPRKVIVGTHISENTAYNLYVVFNIIGVGIGFYLSNVIKKPSFAAVFILIAALLYIYASSLKYITVLKNIIIASILAMSVLIIGIFDLYPATYPGNQKEMATLFNVLTDYAIFAFIINFIREIVKDLQDVKGDNSEGIKTIPVVLGISKTTKIISLFTIIPVLMLSWYIQSYLMENNLYFITIYALIFIIAPLLFFIVKCWNVKSEKDFAFLSNILKIIIFFGIISVVLLTYNIKLNVGG